MFGDDSNIKEQASKETFGIGDFSSCRPTRYFYNFYSATNTMTDPTLSSSPEDLQIEISANTDLVSVTVTRGADSRVESVVCIPRGRAVVRRCHDQDDPLVARFKSPIKDGRRSALGDRWRGGATSETTTSSRVRFIPDDFEDVPPSCKQKPTGQRFHLRIAYPNGFKRRPADGVYPQNSMTAMKD